MAKNLVTDDTQMFELTKRVTFDVDRETKNWRAVILLVNKTRNTTYFHVSKFFSDSDAAWKWMEEYPEQFRLWCEYLEGRVGTKVEREKF